MTSREAVRTALAIGGIWLLFSSLSESVSIAAWSVNNSGAAELPFPEFLALPVASVIPILLFGVAPGIYAIKASARWAATISKSDDERFDLDPTIILPACVMVFAISIAVPGVGGIGSSGLVLLTLQKFSDQNATMPPQIAENFLRSVFSLISGIALFSWGRSAMRRITSK